MVDSKVQTVIVNHTQQELRVGNRNCFAKLAAIPVGGEHEVEIDVNWTYQEFSLEPAGRGGHVMKIIISSDECCDYERITVTMSEGSLRTEKIGRGQSGCNVTDDLVNTTTPVELNRTSDHSLRPPFTKRLPKRLKFNRRFWH